MIFYKQNINFCKYDQSSKFFKELDHMLNYCGNTNDSSQLGNAQCTLTHSLGITSITDFNDFFNDCIQVNLPYKVKIIRAWANRMYYGCSGKQHNHNTKCDYVLVFYYCAEYNSAKFVVTGVKEFNVKTGDLIGHEPHIWHTVTEHKSFTPRISIIFEVAHS